MELNYSLNMSFIKPLKIHQQYGVIDIPGIEVIDIKKSSKSNKKYAITIKYQGKTKTIHYGNVDSEHYEDRTPLKAYSHLNNYDKNIRKVQLSKRTGLGSTQLPACGVYTTVNDPFKSNRWAVITLW